MRAGYQYDWKQVLIFILIAIALFGAGYIVRDGPTINSNYPSVIGATGSQSLRGELLEPNIAPQFQCTAVSL